MSTLIIRSLSRFLDKTRVKTPYLFEKNGHMSELNIQFANTTN